MMGYYTYTDFGGFGGFDFSGADMGDIFGDIFGDLFHSKDGKKGGSRSSRFSGGFHNGSHGYGGFEDSFYGGGFSQDSFRGRGRDLQAEVEVSFDEAAFGCDKLISLQNADGMGGPAQSLQVHIPAGIENGKKVRIRGKGMPGYGDEAGDLLLKVKVGEKQGFERKGMDVYSTITIPFTTAVFGGEAPVQTLSGKIMCRIREGIQPGTKIRLKGKGIVSMKDANVHGDQYVTVQIQVPRHLNAEARQKLMEYKKAAAGGR